MTVQEEAEKAKWEGLFVPPAPHTYTVATAVAGDGVADGGGPVERRWRDMVVDGVAVRGRRVGGSGGARDSVAARDASDGTPGAPDADNGGGRWHEIVRAPEQLGLLP